MMTLPLAPTMPTRSSLYQREGAAGFAQRRSDAGAHGESRRRGHRPSGTRGKHPRAEQTCKDGAERRQPERWRSAKQADCGPPEPRPPRIATFPIPLSVTRRAQREARRRGRVWAAHCPARPYRVRRTRHRAPRKRSAQCSRGRQRHRAVGCSPWPRRPPHPRSMRRARARTDRQATTNPRADDGRDDAASGRGARQAARSLYETGRTMEARGPPPRCQIRRKVAANSVASGLYRRSLIPLRRAAPSPQRGTLRYPSRGRRVRR